MIRPAIICIIYAVSELVFAASASADLSWLAQADNCASFSRGLQEYFNTIPDAAALNAEQRKELSIVLDEACGERFASCDFAVCRTIGDRDAASGAASPVPDGQDSLSWLNRFMTCEQFTAELKQRYGGGAGYVSASAEKKRELAFVLDTACSARFAHCGFKNCARPGQQTPAAAGDARTPPVPPLPASTPHVSAPEPVSSALPEAVTQAVAPALLPAQQSLPQETVHLRLVPETAAPPVQDEDDEWAAEEDEKDDEQALPLPVTTPKAVSTAAPVELPAATPLEEVASTPALTPVLVTSPEQVVSPASTEQEPALAQPSSSPEPEQSPAPLEVHSAVPAVQPLAGPVASVPEIDLKAAHEAFLRELADFKLRRKKMIEQAVAEEKAAKAEWGRLSHPGEQREVKKREEGEGRPRQIIRQRKDARSAPVPTPAKAPRPKPARKPEVKAPTGQPTAPVARVRPGVIRSF